jgi:hypothetical protein
MNRCLLPLVGGFSPLLATATTAAAHAADHNPLSALRRAFPGSAQKPA